jgi:excinuclease ABC subunit C
MNLHEKAALLPLAPGVYLYKDAGGRVIYVGKAKSLRQRVRSYFSDERLADTKTGTLISEATDIDYILVDNNKEALALENNLIKQWQPRFNILLRDDKTYPYIKLTAEKYPRVYVTRRLRKDGSTYYGPYFPGNLAHRLVHFIHRHFLVPSCKVDLTRYHPKPCLQYHIHRCLGPCVEGLTTDDEYARAVRDVRLFLEGRHTDLAHELRGRMEAASEDGYRFGSRPRLSTAADSRCTVARPPRRPESVKKKVCPQNDPFSSFPLLKMKKNCQILR